MQMKHKSKLGLNTGNSLHIDPLWRARPNQCAHIQKYLIDNTAISQSLAKNYRQKSSSQSNVNCSSQFEAEGLIADGGLQFVDAISRSGCRRKKSANVLNRHENTV